MVPYYDPDLNFSIISMNGGEFSAVVVSYVRGSYLLWVLRLLFTSVRAPFAAVVGQGNVLKYNTITDEAAVQLQSALSLRSNRLLRHINTYDN
jgi:hypothetical protein